MNNIHKIIQIKTIKIKYSDFWIKYSQSAVFFFCFLKHLRSVSSYNGFVMPSINYISLLVIDYTDTLFLIYWYFKCLCSVLCCIEGEKLTVLGSPYKWILHADIFWKPIGYQGQLIHTSLRFLLEGSVYEMEVFTNWTCSNGTGYGIDIYRSPKARPDLGSKIQ